MSNITRESFEATIASLLNANPRNSAKGNAMKDWFMNSFSLMATVSHVKESKQIGNRVKEQFGHKAEIVIFVCDSAINRDTLLNKALGARYPALGTLFIIGYNGASYSYEILCSCRPNLFTKWAESTLNIGKKVDMGQIEDASETSHAINNTCLLKKELIREKRSATFVRLALQETMKEDKELSSLMQYANISTTAKRLNVGEFCIGCDSTQLPPRKSDYDREIVWEYNTSSYYLYLEWSKEDVETKFAPEYNKAYKSKFEICKEGEYFVLYQINQNAEYTQRIYYGCPGSGKSHQVKKITEKIDSHYVFRTTFHPDTDYASFVGCYKPSMKGGKNFCQYKTLPELKAEADIINSTSGDKVSRIISFVTKYAEDLQYIVDTDSNIKSLQNLLNKNLSFANETYLAFIVDYVLKNQETRIVYEFCPQIFTNAYVKAWEDTSKPVYLIIEEINRGNCAQIFGDLFQLLDRKNGVSEYPVKADKDLVEHLKKELGTDHKGIKDGELCLPPNLIIYATMNTSDQSLFPMDSAFKRRWDWEYVPIEYGQKNSNNEDNDSYNFIIKIGGNKYKWIKFLKKVNYKIYDTTLSEDKQMGNYFIKDDVNELQFVNKVMFYLWNEVCKDEYKTQRNFFRKGNAKDNEECQEFKFVDLFTAEEGKNIEQTRVDILTQFMAHLEVTPEPEPKGENSEPKNNEQPAEQ